MNEVMLSMIHNQLNQTYIWKTSDLSEETLEDIIHLAGKINDLAGVQSKCISVQSINKDGWNNTLFSIICV